MYNQPFFIPSYYSSAIPNLTRGAMLANPALSAGSVGRGASLFGKLGNAVGAIKSFNWGGLINNTSKTLGIVNQTIPLVRQVGPMVGNMRSMLKIASAFKDETDTSSTNNQNIIKNQPQNTNNITYDNRKEEKIVDYTTNDSPTFFIN